jgi:hypothetical protein
MTAWPNMPGSNFFPALSKSISTSIVRVRSSNNRSAAARRLTGSLARSHPMRTAAKLAFALAKSALDPSPHPCNGVK